MTKNCSTALVSRFFCDSRELRQLRLRCIMSWSSPFMAMVVNTPARNCLKKYWRLFGSSKKKMRDSSLDMTAFAAPSNVSPRPEAM